MADVRVECFVEDQAQEAFLRAFIDRTLREKSYTSIFHFHQTRGAGRLLEEFKAFQTALQKGQRGFSAPDLLVLARDANCSGHNDVHRELQEAIDRGTFPVSAIACPDPHIERWFMADPASFAEVVGGQPKVGKRKCERDLYKKKLRESVLRAGIRATLGGLELAEDIVRSMDMYRAGKREPSLRSFYKELNAAF